MQQFKSNQQKEKVYTSLVIVGVISSIMLFAGLSSAVLVRKMDKFWVNIHLPNAFMVSTIIILISSLLMYLALKNARLSNKKKTVNYLIGSFILCLFFTFFQFQGWKKYYQQGNAVKSFITFVYGQYGQSYLIYDSGIPIEYNGEDYMKDGKKLSEQELNNVKLFLRQICGYGTSFEGSNLFLKEYENPYSIFDVNNEVILENSKNGLALNGNLISEGQKDELFKFSYGVCNDQPFFMLKGRYGEDFSIALNGEDLIYDKKKLFFPSKELTALEKNTINQKVFQSGKEYLVSGGAVYLDDLEINNFDGYFQLKPGVNIHIENDYWERVEEELNPNQYAEFYQTSNVSSSFVWVLTIIHFLHLILSLSGIIVVAFRANNGRYHSENTAGLKAIGVFWHFVGLLWLYLYVFLEFIN
ncbi:cytochrome c oxidase subunit 3 [Flavobacteriales bacterium]|jgi:cytochrome c oxidase subunit 3|nr:cytochrome c oxidase subunit 3 [Flavobacteriales bacterium]